MYSSTSPPSPPAHSWACARSRGGIHSQPGPLPVMAHSLRPELLCAVEAARSKQAQHVALFDLRKLGAFTDYFLICTGFSHPQIRAIGDAIEEQLAQMGIRHARREGDRRS